MLVIKNKSLFVDGFSIEHHKKSLIHRLFCCNPNKETSDGVICIAQTSLVPLINIKGVKVVVTILFFLLLFYKKIPKNMSLKLTELVTRSGAGKAGKPVRVRANFFEVTRFITSNVFHYDITIDPPTASPAIYRKVWRAFEDSNGQGILMGIKTIYDGRKNVFSPKALPLGEENAMQFEVCC